jgi:hypothetical protein
MMKLFLVFTFLIGANGRFLPTTEGDTCGIEGSNFLETDFIGSAAVAGDGCTLGSDTNCLCAPNFDDVESLSGFTWQCNGEVQFGPKNDKVCPEKVPVIHREGVNSIEFNEDLLGVPVPCNTSIHPTGRPGDEVCGYSECESGGSFTAICGCVDLGNRSDVTTSEMQWICLHSTCGCGANNDLFNCRRFDFICKFRSYILYLLA